jgi:hypothetical protein
LGKQDEAILVRELAKEIYPTLLFGGDPAGSGQGKDVDDDVAASGRVVGGFGSGIGKRVMSSMRRATSESVVDVGSYRELREKKVPESQRVNDGWSLREGPTRDRKEKRDVGGTMGSSAAAGPGVNVSTSVVTSPIRGEERERPKHKRKISRSQLKYVFLCPRGSHAEDRREVQWQTDENGRLKTVRAPSRTS